VPGARFRNLGDVTTIDEYLENARSRLNRVSPDQVEAAVADGALLIDIRPPHNRADEGDMPGALVIDRVVLEWRLAPSSDARIVDVEPGQKVILFCNDGYQSSLAAATLLDLGVDGATDLVGGYRAWRETVKRPR
jgi:rhodanese-related sulfurtransferase